MATSGHAPKWSKRQTIYNLFSKLPSITISSTNSSDILQDSSPFENAQDSRSPQLFRAKPLRMPVFDVSPESSGDEVPHAKSGSDRDTAVSPPAGTTRRTTLKPSQQYHQSSQPRPAHRPTLLMPFGDLLPPPHGPPPLQPSPTVIPPTPLDAAFEPFSDTLDRPRSAFIGAGKLRKIMPADAAVDVIKSKPASSSGSPSKIDARHRTQSGDLLEATRPFDPTSSPQSRGRTTSYHSEGATSNDEQHDRRSWVPGRSRGPSRSLPSGSPKAWILTPDGPGAAYSSDILKTGERVPELWDNGGDVFVYLQPKSTGCTPSFRIRSELISASSPLLMLAFGMLPMSAAGAGIDDEPEANRLERAIRHMQVRAQDSAGISSPQYSPSEYSPEAVVSEGHLYFPSPLDAGDASIDPDAEYHAYLVSVRNLFAFLSCQSIVGTTRHPTIFAAFNMIAAHLTRLGFTSHDGTTFGESVTNSFSVVLEGFQLADVRKSREKTIEGLIMGERMKSAELYNEAFAHAVGKYHDILDIKSELFTRISDTTRNRIERAYIELSQRKRAAGFRLENFEFPALFNGIAASNMNSEERKGGTYTRWQRHFLLLRKHFLAYYKEQWGSWPPRKGSRKNHFSRSGLSRLVLRTLYFDLATAYDLLVDRTNPTTRADGVDEHRDFSDPNAASHIALRKLLEESDASSPPVQPPIPFDVPLIPTMSTLEPKFYNLPERAQDKASTRKLKTHESLLILARSHNLDAHLNTPFLKWFQALEEKEAKQKNCAEMADMRVGFWLFIYVVLQSLPMLVVDAPHLSFTGGVETFLCSPAKGLPPWLDTGDNTAIKRTWYGVAGGSGMVSLPADVVDYGVEGIYRASHCWTMAEKWLGADGSAASFKDPDVETYAFSPVEAPIMPFSHYRNDSASSIGASSEYDGSYSTDQQRFSSSPAQWRERDEHARARSESRSRVSYGLQQLEPMVYDANMAAAHGFGSGSYEQYAHHAEIIPIQQRLRYDESPQRISFAENWRPGTGYGHNPGNSGMATGTGPGTGLPHAASTNMLGRVSHRADGLQDTARMRRRAESIGVTDQNGNRGRSTSVMPGPRPGAGTSGDQRVRPQPRGFDDILGGIQAEREAAKKGKGKVTKRVVKRSEEEKKVGEENRKSFLF